MSQKTFSSFQALGESLGRKPPPPNRLGPSGAKQSFEQEEKYLQAQLLRARNDHNRRLETIQLSKLGTLYRKNKDFDRAIDHYRKTLEIDKENSYALDGLGMSYFQQGDYDQAITWFHKQLNPVVAMANLCRAYRRKGDHREAIRFAERVLDKDPEDVIAMNELGILHRLLGDYDESIHWFEKRLVIEPNNRHALDGLGITCREMGEHDRSIEWFEKLRKLEPNNKHALDGLGITCRAMGDYERAIHWFEKLLKIESNSKQALDGLGITCRAMGDHDRSIRWFEEKLKHYPNDKEGLDGLGITCREMGDYGRSIGWFEKLLKLEPNGKHALDGLGITCREMGDYEQAIGWFEKLRKLEPNNKHALDGLGITCREMGDYEQAIGWFEKKLKLYPNDSYAQRGITTTHRAMGATAEAVQSLKKRLSAAPGDRAAREQLEAIAREYESQGEIPAAKEIVDFLREGQPATISSGRNVSKQGRGEGDRVWEALTQQAARLDEKLDRPRRLLIKRLLRVGELGIMIPTMAHEMKQPLQFILATVRNCQRDIERKAPEAAFILEDLSDIADMVKRIDETISHLRELSRGRPTKREGVAVNDALESALKLFGEQFKAHGIRIQRELAPRLPPVVADRVQLEQTFVNLITNARDALEGLESKRITVRTAARDGEIEIGFADTGCGIPREKQADIFSPLFTTKGEGEGTGLGLYIVRQIILGFDGRIEVDSTLGRGAEFTIRLPVMKEEVSPNEG